MIISPLENLLNITWIHNFQYLLILIRPGKDVSARAWNTTGEDLANFRSEVT